MKTQEISIKHSALGWVKKSIDDHLAEIKTDLNLYIEAEDEALLERVKEGLGVIRGVLLMIEQYGAAMLTEEMVALADFIIGEKPEQGEQALEVMLRAVLQLPDYLEHIQSGHRDIPIAILPLLNDIRAVRNQDLFSEKLLFLPDLSMHQKGAEIQPIDNERNQASKLLAKKLRPVYQLALVNLIREQSVEESLQRLEKVCETLEERSVSEQIARIWWIIGALVESVSRQRLELGVSIKSLLGKVDALFRVILIIGESGLLQRQPIELIKNFLFYIAQPECDGPKAKAIKVAYRLEQFLPSESARSEVLDNIAGPNQALLKTVAEAVKADIESVKSTLEVYVNGDLSRVDELKDLPQEMHIISDTLAMIGLGSQRQLIEAQSDIVKQILAGNQAADEEQLLSMAGELLQVEHALEQMQKRQSVNPVEPMSETDISRAYVFDSVLTAVVTAALDNIQKAKNSILEFIKDSSRGENIELCIALMEESRGALQLLNKHRAAAVVEGLLTYLKGYDIVDFMDAGRLDALSQVVASLEYYLEALGEHRGDADSILDSADTQLQELQSKVPINNSAEQSPALVVVADQAEGEVVAAKPVAADGDEKSAVARIRTVADAQTRPVEKQLEVVPVDDELAVLKPGSDPEILEIYLEEAGEEAQNIERLQQDWLLHPEDENAVRNIRRAFHTIKGSGRLVGAMKIGEFAWEFEQLLNRVIDKTVPSDKRVIETVGKAAGALQELVVELKTATPPETDINYLRGLARALAEFKAERLLFERTQSAPTVESSYDRIIDIDETEWKGIGVSADTQIIKPEDLNAGSLDEIEAEGLNAGLLDEIEPDTIQVESAAFEITRGQQAEAGDDSQATSTEAGLGDTLFAPPSRVPGKENYTQAIDYAQTATDQAKADTAGPEAFAIDGIESASRESIMIETIGEDFLGNDFDDDFDDGVTLETAIPESIAVESAIVGEPEVEAPSVVEVTEIEEVVMETTAPEDDELVPQAVELETQEIEIEALEPDFEASEVTSQTQTTETGVDTTAAVETSAVVESGAGEDQEGSPDPLVDTTGDRMPGDEAGDSDPRAQEPLEPTGLSFDPELLIIYQQEVEQHLGIVSSALDHAEQIQELVPSEEVYRALHTIHGASRTADISTIGELAGLMEKPLKLAISQKMALDHEIVALYREGQRALTAMTDELVSTRQLPDISEDLRISFIALAEDFEEHTVEIPDAEEQASGDFIDTLTMMSKTVDPEPDNELLTIFIDEANELLEMSDNALHLWSEQEANEAGAVDYSALMELQRYLHTLKGGARMAELQEISDLSHEMESMFIGVIDGRVDKNDNLIELLKNCFDLLHRQVVEAQDGQEMSDCTTLVGLLRNLRRGKNDEPGEEFSHDGTIVGMDMDGEDIVNDHLPAELPMELERPSQDVVKVRSDLLDNLVNSAGEVSIYRARMEQQVAGLGSHLGELGQTISRLKGQLRSLEAETDAQIHFSHRAESGRVGEFDPLEMDRYTLIQELSRSLGESVNDLSSLQSMLGEQVKDSETLLLQQSRVNTDLQDGLIKSRMVKFSGLLSRLRRLVRQSSQELGKKAELIVSGEENEVDNKVLDRMVAPLEHIIRNALSHGIETPVERVNKGKSESGRITIDIARDGADVVIRVSDDGAGISIEKVRSRAIQLGLLDKSHPLSEADLVQYILEPGFSTAEHVTQMSGRGIGMDVVDVEIKQLGGTLQIETSPQGTTFIARLPFTLSINQAILVRTDEEIYAIPLINIEGITRLDSQQMLDYYRQEEPELEYAGQHFALHNLSKLVGSGVQLKPGVENEKQTIIFSRAGDVRVALHVDEIIGNREIVVKTLGKQLSQVKALAGASILADGSVVLILDISGLIRHSASNAVKVVYQQEDDHRVKMRGTVMVVDDSITMRRVASKLLERHNYQVVTAKDGVDALAQLQDLRPDVMLLDIEMPRMDGFELATHMQNEATFSKIPIIMITSRTGEKHRHRAIQIGVTNYMGKPYQEEELIENIQTALEAG